MKTSTAPPGSFLWRADHTLRTDRGTETFYSRVFGPALLRRPGRILDVGAGDSPYGAGRTTVVRLDPAYRNDPPAAPANCVSALCEALPFRNATFDTVLASFVVQHVTDPHLALAEILRVCPVSGIVAVFPIWRPQRLPAIGDLRPVRRRGRSLIVHRPDNAEVQRITADLVASGALEPSRLIAVSARWGMRLIVCARGTTRFRVIRRPWTIERNGDG
jgi:SAM-dependent methyltransferase